MKRNQQILDFIVSRGGSVTLKEFRQEIRNKFNPDILLGAVVKDLHRQLNVNHSLNPKAQQTTIDVRKLEESPLLSLVTSPRRSSACEILIEI